MIDTMQLTAIMTDPTPRTVPPEHGGANELLGVVQTDGAFTQRVGWLGKPGRFDWVRDRLPDRESISVRKVGLAASSLVFVTGGLVAGAMIASTSATPPPSPHSGLGAVAHRLVISPSDFDLPQANTIPLPAKPLVALDNPTKPHEVFGYAPYWSLPNWQSFPVKDFSTIAYFSVNVNPNGSIQQSGPGWNGYESEDFVNLINAAHAAGDKVVLTANDFSEDSLYTLTHDPNAGVVLGTQLLELVQTKNLDGVNLDLEGTGSADQSGLDRLVSQVDYMLHAANSHYQLTMATYASSAGDPSGFYDIAGLSKWVDAFFVMAYDVSEGPTGKKDGNGGEDDATYVQQYVAAVGPSKVILGVPLFGYDEPTSGPALGDQATGAAVPVPYSQAVASGPTYWDAATDTAWTSYQQGSQWHQVFFDNPNTLQDKVQLVSDSGLLGIGVWALGMEGNDNSILNLLSGSSGPLRTPPIGPTTPAAATVISRAVKQKHAAGTGGGTGSGNTVGGGTTTTTSTSTAGTGGGGKHKGTTGSTSTTTTTSLPASTTTTTTTLGTTTTTTPATTTTTVPATTTTTTTTPTTTTTTVTTTTTTGDTGDTGNTGGGGATTTTTTVTPQ